MTDVFSVCYDRIDGSIDYMETRTAIWRGGREEEKWKKHTNWNLRGSRQAVCT